MLLLLQADVVTPVDRLEAHFLKLESIDRSVVLRITVFSAHSLVDALQLFPRDRAHTGRALGHLLLAGEELDIHALDRLGEQIAEAEPRLAAHMMLGLPHFGEGVVKGPQLHALTLQASLVVYEAAVGADAHAHISLQL